MTTLLIADDSAFARAGVKKIITKRFPDWEIVECSSPITALATLQSKKVDVALIDYHMPEMNGLAVAAAGIKVQSNIRIALVTASIQDSLKEKADNIGVSFIGKPVNQDELEKFLAEIA